MYKRPKEFIIYCDESVEKGQYYSDFYGGVLIDSNNLNFIRSSLAHSKQRLNLKSEVKWTKVTGNYLEKYKSLMDDFFEFVKSNKIKVRIMFRQTAFQAKNLTDYNKTHGYFLLYYQFIKHAFGLRYSNETPHPIFLRAFFDELPDSKVKCELFKNHIYALQSLVEFNESKIKIRRDDIQEIDSKKHNLLQCLDVVLGAMAFRLNDMHKVKPKGSYKRGKRTIAKEKLYKHILGHIRGCYPNFNIGMSTGINGDYSNRWNHPYRHWNFIPRDFEINRDAFK